MQYPDLPVCDVLPELADTITHHDITLLRAPTGAGKTTLVPLYLHQAGIITGKIIMLEPRRIATATAAARMADVFGEPVGKTIGYRMQMDNNVSKDTRIEVVTEGVLTRMLQHDPALTDIGLIIFDEFHERSLQGDLGLALSLESQALRDTPLKLLVMSATLNTAQLSEALSAPVVTSEGFLHPVAIEYLDRPLPRRDQQAVYREVISLIHKALRESEGSALMFLPGAGEIRQVYQALTADTLPENTDVFALFGELSLKEQQKAIEAPKPGQRKIVLATAIAETSLTIEGIRIVIDAGLSRRAIYDPGTGMNKLETRRLSKSSADQRKGRAGRLTSGTCYRLWTRHEHQQLEAEDAPEIQEADLSPLALELFAWGSQTPDELFWLNPPPTSRYQQAVSLLTQLHALSDHGRITHHGKAMAALGAHPRIANMLLIAAQYQMAGTGCRLAALLSERDIFLGNSHRSVDIQQRLEAIDTPSGFALNRQRLMRIKKLESQFLKRLKTANNKTVSPESTGRLLLAAYPDRVAKQRADSPVYQTSNGQGIELNPDDRLVGSPFLVVPDMGGHSNRRNARIFLACAVDKALIYDELADSIETIEVIEWDNRLKRINATTQDKLGALVLSQQRLNTPAPDAMQQAMTDGIRANGLDTLPWTKEAQQLVERLRFLHRVSVTHPNAAFPAMDEPCLLDTLEDWLAPYLTGINRLEHLSKLNLEEILRARLSWEQQQTLDKEAPTVWPVPSGSSIRIRYDNPEGPVLSVRLQELFGMETTPMVGFGQQPLTIELLSPAQRPVQITRDLKSFWQSTYQDVKKDLKGRYPKHYWPDDPTVAEATRYTKRKR